MSLLVNGNFFFKPKYASVTRTPGLLTLNFVPQQLILLLVFLFLLFKNILNSIFVMGGAVYLRFSYRRFFKKQFTIQRAPMAHRQWSQEQYALRGFFFSISLRSSKKPHPGLFKVVGNFPPLGGSFLSFNPFVVFFAKRFHATPSKFILTLLINNSAALLLGSSSSLLPVKSTRLSMSNFGGFLR